MSKKLLPPSLPPAVGLDGLIQEPIEWHPHKGQKEGMKFFIEHACGLLLADPGVGKTTTTLGAYKVLKQKKLAHKMLVIAPLKPCHMVWGPEVQKWIDFHHLRVVVLHGPKKDELLKQDADIYVINYDGLAWLTDARVETVRNRKVVTVDLARFKSFGFDTLVFDELSKVKDTQSVRFKILKAINHTFARRWGLTGSPAANGLMDLFGEVYMIDGGRAFGPYITHFRNTYFVRGYDGYSWDLKDGAADKIYERIRPIALRQAAEDYIDMPEMVEVDRVFDLPSNVKAAYMTLERELIMAVEAGEVTASNMAVASMKCRQVTSGAIYKDPEINDIINPALIRKSRSREWIWLHDEKLDLLEDLIDELQGQPLFLAYDFHHDLERLRSRFGKDLPHLGSGVSPKEMVRIQDEWNAGRIPLLAAHPRSAGHGLNLQGFGNHVCWFTPTFDYDLYDQFNRRILRQGQKAKRVFVHRLLARSTVDFRQVEALAGKRNCQEAFHSAMKRKA